MIGKGIDPGLTPSPSPMPSSSCKCFANGASNEAFCESETNPITDPIVCESDSRCHWGPAQDSNCRAMVITQSGPPQCASTCGDLVQQPSCGVARYYIDTCASSCSTTEKENFLKRASNQPCTFASASTPPPSSDPSPSPGGGSGEFGSGDVGSGDVGSGDVGSGDVGSGLIVQRIENFKAPSCTGSPTDNHTWSASVAPHTTCTDIGTGSIYSDYCDMSTSPPTMRYYFFHGRPDCSGPNMSYGHIADGATCIDFADGTSSRFFCGPPPTDSIVKRIETFATSSCTGSPTSFFQGVTATAPHTVCWTIGIGSVGNEYCDMSISPPRIKGSFFSGSGNRPNCSGPNMTYDHIADGTTCIDRADGTSQRYFCGPLSASSVWWPPPPPGGYSGRRLSHDGNDDLQISVQGSFELSGAGIGYAVNGALNSRGVYGSASVMPRGSTRSIEPMGFTGRVGWDGSQLFPITADADGSYGSSRVVYGMNADFASSPMTFNQSLTPTNVSWLSPMAMTTLINLSLNDGMQLAVDGSLDVNRSGVTYSTNGTAGSKGSVGTVTITPHGATKWLEPTGFAGRVGWSDSGLFPITADADGSYGSSRVVYGVYADFASSPMTFNQSLTPTNVSWLSPMAMTTLINLSLNDGMQLAVDGSLDVNRSGVTYSTNGTAGSKGSVGTVTITPHGATKWLEPTGFAGRVGWSDSGLFPITADADGSYGSSRVVYGVYADFASSPMTFNQSLTPTNVSWLSPMAMTTLINLSLNDGMQLAVDGSLDVNRSGVTYSTNGTAGSKGSVGTVTITPHGATKWLEPTGFAGRVGWSDSGLFPITADADGSYGSSRVVYGVYADFGFFADDVQPEPDAHQRLLAVSDGHDDSDQPELERRHAAGCRRLSGRQQVGCHLLDQRHCRLEGVRRDGDHHATWSYQVAGAHRLCRQGWLERLWIVPDHR